MKNSKKPWSTKTNWHSRYEAGYAFFTGWKWPWALSLEWAKQGDWESRDAQLKASFPSVYEPTSLNRQKTYLLRLKKWWMISKRCSRLTTPYLEREVSWTRVLDWQNDSLKTVVTRWNMFVPCCLENRRGRFSLMRFKKDNPEFLETYVIFCYGAEMTKARSTTSI